MVKHKNKTNRERRRKTKKLLKRMQRKLWIVFGFVCVLFVVLIGRIMYIEYTSGDKYTKIVLSQQDYSSTIIPYQRGDIVDSKGTVLATSIDVYNVILDCKVLNANEDKIDSTIEAITTCIPEITEEQIRTALEEDASSEYTILAKKVSAEEEQAFQDMLNDEDTGSTITGIWFETEYQREYPYGSLASALIGFSTSTTGVIGLENEYNSTLNGVNGRSYGYQNEDSNLEQTVIEATDGNTLVTSLDVNIQTIVENAILDWNNQHLNEDGTGTGSSNTAAIVMDPDTGEILAMATYPSFDLNNPRDLSAYYSEEELANMSEDEKMDALNQLWQNFTITSTYEPGSTFKPFTIAMGLESGALTGDETFYCDGGETVSGTYVRCESSHGLLNIGQALAESCNDALMQMSYLIGGSTFAKYQSIFGFGQKTNIDLPGEASTAGLIYDEDALNSSAINLATNAFGQNFNTTMIQLASGFASLINGGKLYQPHVVTAIQDSSGNTVEEIDPVVEQQTVSEEVSDQMREYLLGVVQNGTGTTAAVDGYNIGGKTGTAQKLPRGNGNYLVSFIGYAPQNDPEVLVYVVIDEPNVEDQAHSNYAQEIAHSIFEQILPYMNIATAEEEAAQTAE